MKKIKILSPMLALAILFVAASCGNGGTSGDAPETPYHINMAVLPGPSALGALWLMDAARAEETQNSYDIRVLGTPEEVVPLIVQGAVDIAAVPTNMASVLHNNPNVDVTMLALSTMGVLHVIDTTGEIADMADLAGRTVHLSGYGAAPQFAFNYVLRQNGLEPDVDVELIFQAEMPQIAALMAEGIAEIALLPEPFATTVTMQNENARHALDLTQEWNRVQPDYGLVMTAIIVRSEFLAQHPDAVGIFMSEFEQSINFINNNVSEAAALAVDFGVIPNEAIAAAAIPRSNQVFITGERMRNYTRGYLGVLYAQAPASIGGALPDEAFYFIP
ncbi:MAG: ABC transporter substrate-binding protein [Clostridiales bacterium]|jgi:NitT/TauT family transport system substrate-binding protein|nr:ABC transporter substrate-binding protein [Clostridiales bacterium]